MTTSISRARNPRPAWQRLAVVAILLAATGATAGVAYLLLRPAPPSAVGLASLPAATATASIETSASPASPEATNAPSTDDGLDGTWSVDPSIGSIADFSGSFVGYRIDEELANIGAQTAVGRTPDVTGSLVASGTRIRDVSITADVTTLKSDDDRRDGQLQRQALESATYPTVTFVLTQPIELAAVPEEGETIQVTATGDLTIHGQTRSVQIPLEARLSGGVATVVGSIDVALADYGMEQPRSFLVLSIADTATIEFQLHFTKSA